jgi:predicted ArsR family transcriptional regulator
MAKSIKLSNAGKPFSDKAVGYLVSRAGRMSAKSIANVLGRTEKAIRRKAEKLGLSLATN